MARAALTTDWVWTCWYPWAWNEKEVRWVLGEKDAARHVDLAEQAEPTTAGYVNPLATQSSREGDEGDDVASNSS